MKDLFTEYKKKSIKKNIAILSASFVFALSLNMFLYGTETGNKLQTSVVNYAGQTSEDSDLFLVSAGEKTDIIKLKAGTAINDATELRVTFLFDPSKVALLDFFSQNKALEIVKISNIDGVVLLNLHSSTPLRIAKNEEILNIVYKKTTPDDTRINLSETQFVSDAGIAYELTNSSIQF